MSVIPRCATLFPAEKLDGAAKLWWWFGLTLEMPATAAATAAASAVSVVAFTVKGHGEPA